MEFDEEIQQVCNFNQSIRDIRYAGLTWLLFSLSHILSRILTFDNELYIHMSSENYEENGYGHDLGLSGFVNSLSCTICVFHILQEVGAELIKYVH